MYIQLTPIMPIRAKSRTKRENNICLPYGNILKILNTSLTEQYILYASSQLIIRNGSIY